MLSREELVQSIRARYIPIRVSKVEPEFIDFEESACTLEDLTRIVATPLSSILVNKHNSALLYVVGITDAYDFTRNVDTIGGSYPDIDSDFETLEFPRLLEWVNEYYGEECVAAIGTLSKFKPKSIVDKYFNATAPRNLQDGKYEKQLAEHFAVQKEIKDMIPDALFGKEPTLEECVKGNSLKGYAPHSQLATDPKYKPWYEVAKKLEGMVSTYSVHASGIVITDFSTHEICPTITKETKDEITKEPVRRRITQMPMGDVEELGLLKVDMLRIDCLNIIKSSCQLIQDRHGITLHPYKLEDFDPKTYELIVSGNLSGVFQLETSQATKDWLRKMKPESIEDLGAISALVRPGPLQAGLPAQYVLNKEAGTAPDELHPFFAESFKDSYWVLAYQEQLMTLLSKAAGFTLQEADSVRRAVGKKITSKLVPYRQAFIDGCINNGVDEDYAVEFWDKTIVGMADYSFNKSHAVAYSYLSYICAYLKANYPTEFFTSLMTVRSQVLTPLKWADRAPLYIQEARQMGIHIKTPDINRSAIGFTVLDESNIHFGFNSIRKIGYGASELLTKARGTGKFKDVMDFLGKVNRQKINIGVFNNLALSGCFDSLGYDRNELVAASQTLYDWFAWGRECEDRAVQNELRKIENVHIQELINQRDEIRKRAKKKGYELTEEESAFLEENKRLMLKRVLTPPTEPEIPVLTRSKQITLSIQDLKTQGELIGCYLPHPARIAYPNARPIASIRERADYLVAGIVSEIKTYKNSRGTTHYVSISDGTDSLRMPIYSNNKIKPPTKGDLIWAECNIGIGQTFDEEGENINLKCFSLKRMGIWEA